MAKKVLWSVAAAAAVALVAMRVVGLPAGGEGHGSHDRRGAAISGAADHERGREDRGCAASGLPAERPVPQLVNDKVAQKALKNEDFQRALRTPSVRAALARADARLRNRASNKAAG